MAIIRNQNTVGFPKNRCLQPVAKNYTAAMRAAMHNAKTVGIGDSHILFYHPANTEVYPQRGDFVSFERASVVGNKDWEGLYRGIPDEAVNCIGVRPVRNVFPADINSSLNMSEFTVTLTDFPGAGIKGSDILRIEIDGAFSWAVWDGTAKTGIPSSGVADVVVTYYVRRISGTGDIGLLDGSSGVANPQFTLTSNLTTEWKRFSNGSVVGGAAAAIGFSSFDSSATPGDIFEICAIQTEVVSGQSNQNPGEFISVGVGHVLATDDPSLDISANWGQSNCVVAGGECTFSSGLGTLSNSVKVARPFALYKVTIAIEDFVSAGGGNPTWGGINVPAITGNGTVTFIDRNTSVTTGLVYQGFNTDMTITDFFAEEIQHGSNIDEFRYFPYENGNTIISNVVIEAQGSAIIAATQKGILFAEGVINEAYPSTPDSSHANWSTTAIETLADEIVGIDEDGKLQTITDYNFDTGENAAISLTGLTSLARHEPSFMLKGGTFTGTLSVNASPGTGQWDVDMSHADFSSNGKTLINRYHPSVTITVEFAASAAGTLAIGFVPDGTISPAENIGIGLFNLIEGTIPTPMPIFTYTGSVNTVADVAAYVPEAELTGANVNNLIFKCIITPLNDPIDFSSNKTLFHIQGTASDQLLLNYFASTGKLRFVKLASSTLYFAESDAALVAGVSYDVECHFDSNGLRLKIDGVFQLVDDSDTTDVSFTSSPTNLFIGSDVSELNQSNSEIENFRIENV